MTKLFYFLQFQQTTFHYFCTSTTTKCIYFNSSSFEDLELGEMLKPNLTPSFEAAAFALVRSATC